jgi:hypothetical protein
MESRILVTIFVIHCRELEQLLLDVSQLDPPLFDVYGFDWWLFDTAGIADAATARTRATAAVTRILALKIWNVAKAQASSSRIR